MTLRVRAETDRDRASVYAINAAAFGRQAEASGTVRYHAAFAEVDA